MSNLVKQSGDKYYLQPDTEITKEQYDAINSATEQSVSGNSSEADILRLHQESDPASPLFKGPEPVNSGVSGTAAEESQPASAYYEPTADKVDPIADETPEPAGTTAISTEEATIPAEVAPETKVPREVEHIVTEETLADNPDLVDEGVKAGDPITYPSEDESNTPAQ